MPTATDLVTDLPADFEVFGQAVATSMADLLGGTSGQILAKNSNTDMDFVWIANDQGDITGITASSPLTGGGTSGDITIGILSGTTSNLGAVQLSTSTSSTSTSLAATASAVKSAYDLADAAIPKSLIDAAGDLIVGTADNTAGRVGIGTTGQVLTVSGGTAVWSTPVTGNGPTFSVASNTAQSVSQSTNTKVTFQVENWDTASNFASSRFTPTTAGYYQINAVISFTGSTNFTYRTMIYKNGSSWSNGGMSIGVAVANPSVNISSLVYLNGTTDYVELYGWTDSTGTREFYRSYLDGVWIRS
jgi:hypothetical protein